MPKQKTEVIDRTDERARTPPQRLDPWKIENIQTEKIVGAKKYDEEKPRLELLPPSYWEMTESNLSAHLAKWFYGLSRTLPKIAYDSVPVLEFGAKKYGDFNWLKGMKWSRLVGAFHRHCNKQIGGFWSPRDLEELDSESCLRHGSHAACCLIFLNEYLKRASDGDDIHKKNDDRVGTIKLKL